MERRTIIILIILAVLVGGYFVVKAVFFPTDTSGTTTVNTPGQTESAGNVAADPYKSATAETRATFPTGNKFLVSANGGTIETNNFFAKAEGYYPEMQALLIVRNQKYQLVFYRLTGEFSLTISQDTLDEDITGIQAEVMNILGVGKPDLCKLQVNYLREYDGGELDDLGLLPLCASVLK